MLNILCLFQEIENTKLLKFRDTTLVPYEPKLIDISMLSPSHVSKIDLKSNYFPQIMHFFLSQQRRWLNNYNKRIRNEVGPEMLNKYKMEAYQWMEKRTRSIPEDGDDVNHLTENSSPVLPKHSNLLVTFVILFHTWISECIIWLGHWLALNVDFSYF